MQDLAGGAASNIVVLAAGTLDTLNQAASVSTDPDVNRALSTGLDSPAPAGITDNPDAPPVQVPMATLVRLATSAANSGAPNPYGCYGQTDLPHVSYGEPGVASVHARTNCGANVGRVDVATSLYRGRWYGAQHLGDAQQGRNFAYSSNDAVARWRCAGTGTYTYEGDSDHEVTDGANRYYTSTTRSDRFAC